MMRIPFLVISLYIYCEWITSKSHGRAIQMTLCYGFVGTGNSSTRSNVAH